MKFPIVYRVQKHWQMSLSYPATSSVLTWENVRGREGRGELDEIIL